MSKILQFSLLFLAAQTVSIDAMCCRRQRIAPRAAQTAEPTDRSVAPRAAPTITPAVGEQEMVRETGCDNCEDRAIRCIADSLHLGSEEELTGLTGTLAIGFGVLFTIVMVAAPAGEETAVKAASGTVCGLASLAAGRLYYKFDQREQRFNQLQEQRAQQRIRPATQPAEIVLGLPNPMAASAELKRDE